jgi:hypothetical protein
MQHLKAPASAMVGAVLLNSVTSEKLTFNDVCTEQGHRTIAA